MAKGKNRPLARGVIYLFMPVPLAIQGQGFLPQPDAVFFKGDQPSFI
jgi:hypothetical protein